MKKVLSIVLTIVLLLSFIPTGLFSITASAGGYESLIYQIYDREAIIVGCYQTTGTIHIPATLGGYPVTSILHSAFSGTNITGLIIPDTVTQIGEYAFGCCRALTSITIPDSVTSIGEETFYGCSSLTSITIPDSVTSIAKRAFKHCSSLQSITIPESITSIGEETFYGCSSLTNITLSNNITAIADDAFYDCTSLSEFDVAAKNTVYTDIDGVLFTKDKTKLIQYPSGKTQPDYYIPDSTTVIRRSAFQQCPYLKSVNIPNSVTRIEALAFDDCSSLTSITLPFIGAAVDNKINNWFGYIFGASSYSVNKAPSSLKKVVITNINSISNFAFYGCSSLTSITIPNSVTSIGEKAFYGCSSLTSMTIPDSVTNIAVSAFEKCNSLQSITLPFVGQNADGSGCTNFGYIFGAYNTSSPHYKNSTYVPASLKKVTITGDLAIPNFSFYECNSIQNINLTGNVKVIGESAFRNCTALKSVTIPHSCVKIGFMCFHNCNNLQDVYFNGLKSQQKIDIGIGNDQITSFASWYYSGCGDDHSYGNWTTTKAPTCTTTGTESRFCSDCKKEQTRDALAIGHSMGEWTNTKNATCEAKGEQTRSCSKCSHKEIKAINALGHKFSNPTVTKQPTCTEAGIEVGKCILCKKEATNVIPATGHKIEKFTITVEPTCTVDGEIEGVCTTCGLKNAKEIIPSKGHTYGVTVITKEATETELGLKIATCSVCGETKEEVIPYITEETETPSEDATIGDTIDVDTDNNEKPNNMLWILITIGTVVLICCGVATVIFIKKKR